MANIDVLSDTFKGLIKAINEQGQETQPRNQTVKEAVCTSFDIDSYYPISSFKERPFKWKYLAGELAWYLSRNNDISFINHFSKFWSKIINPSTNNVNSNYGYLVINDQQFRWVIESLIEDPYSRQAIMMFNRPEMQFEGNKDFVCTMYINFFIRNNKLYMKVQMRSNDLFYGLTYDAPFFSLLHQTIHRILKYYKYSNLELGDYMHHVDNIYFYESHFQLADKIINNEDNCHYYSFVMKDDLIHYHREKDNFRVQLTNSGHEFIADVKDGIEYEKNDQNVDWYNIITKYFDTNYQIDKILEQKRSLDINELSQ